MGRIVYYLHCILISNFLSFIKKTPQVCKAIIFAILESALKTDKCYLVFLKTGCDLRETNLEVST